MPRFLQEKNGSAALLLEAGDELLVRGLVVPYIEKFALVEVADGGKLVTPAEDILVTALGYDSDKACCRHLVFGRIDMRLHCPNARIDFTSYPFDWARLSRACKKHAPDPFKVPYGFKYVLPYPGEMPVLDITDPTRQTGWLAQRHEIKHYLALEPAIVSSNPGVARIQVPQPVITSALEIRQAA